IYLSQEAYLNQVLERYGMAGAHPVSTPLAVGNILSASQSPQSPDDVCKYKEYSNKIHYLSLIGSLLYAMQTQLDIQFMVGQVAQFGGNPGIPHLQAAKHILRYLKGTLELKLVLDHRGGKAFDLVGWTDSNWAQDPDSRHSIRGFVFEIAGSLVSWSLKKQPTMAMSSVEAEYMASSNAMKEAIWLRTLLGELDYLQVAATIIHTDNQGCIALAHNPVNHSCTKHINIKHHFIHERVKHSEIELRYILMKEMLVDIFTKQVPCEAFIKFRERLGVILIAH
ncbi:Copia protein, partial [Leucoagaricus sp. SymC.cos]